MEELDALCVTIAFDPRAGLRPGSPPALLSAEVDARTWLELGNDELEARGVTERERKRLLDPVTRRKARALFEQTRALGLGLLTRASPEFAVLCELPDAPHALWFRGDATVLTQGGVAVVGSRAATPYGREVARDFGFALGAAGLTVISGLARGVDAAAHRGCLEAGGCTIAVLGCGIDQTYPAENAQLADEIVESGGCVVSETPPEVEALPHLFPRRNRILVGLADALLVVEAARRSGALSSAEWALQYGRPIWAVPGPIQASNSVGCHGLLRDGAGLADSPESFLEELGLESQDHTVHDAARNEALLSTLARGAQSIDALATELGRRPANLLVELQDLIGRGLVSHGTDGLFRLKARRRS